MTISIIKATEEMCEELAQIKKQVWQTTYAQIYPADKIDNFDNIKHAEKFKKYVLAKDIELFVAMIDSKIVGYVAVGQSPHRKEKQIEIVLLYLLKEFQCKGFGKIMFEFAKNKIKQTGAKQFFVSCNKFNHNAQKFYEKMGGKIIHIDEDNEDKSLPQITFLYEI